MTVKLEAPVNPNYAATVVEAKNLVTLDGLDNLVALPQFGLQALVPKNTPIGSLGVFFVAESQLADQFAHYNNLYRHGDKNFDESAKGYLEDNRRVKAIKLRGHRSDALFMPLESLVEAHYINSADLGSLKAGDTFDKIGDNELVRKYVVKAERVKNSREAKQLKKVFKRVDEKMLPEHYDTENWWRNEHHIADDEQIVVTQKLHGTSIRIAHTIVRRQLRWHEKIAKKLGVKVAESEFAHVYGSRKVIKDPNNPAQNHFYGTDIWGDFGKQLDELIPENFIVYGELIGYTPDGAPIQKDYTYNSNVGETRLFVYRVAVVQAKGLIVDLSWDQVKAFASERGLDVVPELWRGKKADFDVDQFVDKNFFDLGSSLFPHMPVWLPPKLVDEGVVIRADRNRWAPYLLKAKSPIFLQHETRLLDEGVADLETVGSEADEELVLA